MRVLIITASKHGATADIGRAIADVMTREGLETMIAEPDRVGDLESTDAVVLGSAVYAGRWMKTMRQLVEREGEELATRPVWLFSSGPIGDPPKPEEDPVDVAPIIEATGAREHRIFSGKLDRKVLNFGERAIANAFKVPDGDFRDWHEVKEWALGIAQELKAKV
jgi:menaquinone-dependent protoporphyrinogen oxidase